MRLSKSPVKEAVFRERLNQYLVLAELNGEQVKVFLPNPGRMKELLIPGARIYLRAAPGDHRKTQYDMISIFKGNTLISIDSRLPNLLVGKELEKGNIPELRGYDNVKREPRVGKSRLDFLLGTSCFVEVKSCTLVCGGLARFPDAPTLRGRRHMMELASVVKDGMRGMVFFLIQRPDARKFMPNDATDPDFGKALRDAVASGVEAIAYTTLVDKEEVHLGKRIPVEL